MPHAIFVLLCLHMYICVCACDLRLNGKCCMISIVEGFCVVLSLLLLLLRLLLLLLLLQQLLQWLPCVRVRIVSRCLACICGLVCAKLVYSQCES